MSFTHSTEAKNARLAKQLQKKLAAHFTGRKRGPNPEVRRDSYDHEDPRAKPWRRIEDGSVGAGLAHREALIQAAEELYREQWRDMPLREIREARAQRAALADELEGLVAGGAAPIGRPATLRQAIARLDAFLDRARARLRRTDLTVLRGLLRHLEFATGRLFPSIETIAAEAGCHRNSVVAALRRLKAHGFVAWVRRSIATGNDGAFAPQREQTSNAYYFDHQRRMASRTFQRFKQLLVAKLRRLGRVPATVRPDGPRTPADPGLVDVLSRLGEAIEARAALAANAST
ncbi:DNA-binding transcriptional regulator YhcF (GntR family) [Sphingomonas jinjuensis]|uniref:DNA-binding transcriptional regulator YhcF (GntR family) n=1 Tax=Sphingomonas jinjuensis TaxID=535907 RepID=A0A840FAS0_9SPHN|nr:helix-turn-helix domain-containing protein [Sphingomonas jinjuensis]MBB4152874.1 DNA-binding transcriptional regulator YhcF (GntR family) [Sphingomonas jinjuensis]